MKKKNVLKRNARKEIKKAVEDKLAAMLTILQPDLGKKQIGKRVKRAGKILTKGIKTQAPEETSGKVIITVQ